MQEEQEEELTATIALHKEKFSQFDAALEESNQLSLVFLERSREVDKLFLTMDAKNKEYRMRVKQADVAFIQGLSNRQRLDATLRELLRETQTIEQKCRQLQDKKKQQEASSSSLILPSTPAPSSSSSSASLPTPPAGAGTPQSARRSTEEDQDDAITTTD